MTKNEFMKVVDAIKAYYPYAKLLDSKAAIALWYEELKDLPYELCVLAVRKHVTTSDKVITIYNIRTNATVESDDWGDAWDRVLKAVGRYGMYNETDALESLDEITRAAVKSIGWKQLCTSESPDVIRGQFRNAYEQKKKKTDDIAKMPKDISGILENKTKLIGWTI